MAMPTPEQAQDLVDYFGSQRAAGRAIGVGHTTLRTWLDPEYRARKYAYAREYNRGWYERLDGLTYQKRSLDSRRRKALYRMAEREQRRQQDG